MLKPILLSAFVLLLAACGSDNQQQVAATAEPTPIELGSAAIDVSSYAARVRTLSSDEFEGRAPFTAGETKTIEFVRDEFKRIGLQPGNGTQWYQPVPLVEINAESASLTLTGLDTAPLKYGTDMMIWTKRVTEQVEIKNTDLVFVGYGIVAPEYDWNDYAGMDVRGKTVVILVNDPGFATQDERLFNGNAMTYYGRWSYKYEEAARQGAAGALIVHETEPAGYPWEVVSGGWSGPKFDLIASDKNFSRVVIEGWLDTNTAGRLFAKAGMSLDEARAKALDRGFRAFKLPGKATGAVSNSFRESTSYNVLGLLPGTDLADEYIIYMAHWDHLGKDTSLEGDQIYNGAVDNATGTAALMELAEAFVSLPQRPRRSILFIAVTAEESGLLGSRYYGTNPVYPLNKTIAGINMDGLNVHGRTRDVAVVGIGSSELEEYLARAAATQNRVLVPEPTPQKGFFYRSDHFNLSKNGVPVIYAESGFDHLDGGVPRGKELASDWVANRYHKPADEYRDDWDLSGAVEDMQLYFLVGYELATSDAWPEWYETSEFRSIRDASLKQ